MSAVRFEDWLLRVDAAVALLAGCSIHDLADVPLRDWYEDGVGANAAARRALRAAGME